MRVQVLGYGGALVKIALHAFGLHYQQDVQVRRESPQGVPFLGPFNSLPQGLHAGKAWVGNAGAGLLLLAVADKFGANHLNVWIERCWRLRVSVGGGRLKRVGGGMGADEALALANEFEKCLLAFRRHRRILVLAGSGQVAGRIEEKRVVLRQSGLGENAAVLGGV